MGHQSKDPSSDQRPLERIPAALSRKKPQKELKISEESQISFLEMFNKVLFSPREGMAMLARTSDLVGPLIVFFAIIVLVGIATFIEYSRIQFTFIPANDVILIESLQNRRLIFDFPFNVVLFISGLFFSVIIFWFFMQLLRLKPEDRSFMRAFSIIGFASIPQILGALIRLIYDLFFYWPPPVTMNLNNGQIDYVELAVTRLIGWPLELVSFILLLWSLLLVYYALRTLEVPRNRILILCALYSFLGLMRLVNIVYTAFIYL
ncbi:MAG: Yip1 family protein [Candidatus Hermodarchaeota archaeon]